MKTLEQSKINDLFSFDEKQLKDLNNYILIGTDEAGRGPLAGPVTAAAVCFNEVNKELKSELIRLNDSKKLTHKIRKELCDEIKKHSFWSICECTVEEIESYNILQASLIAMKRSCRDVLKQLGVEDCKALILVDGKFIIPDYIKEQQYIIKGDSKSASIAAASILAKVARDDLMIKLSEEFPQYDWHKNKGYGTKTHRHALKEYGKTIWHRPSFLKKLL